MAKRPRLTVVPSEEALTDGVGIGAADTDISPDEALRVMALVDDAGPEILTEDEQDIYDQCCAPSDQAARHEDNLALTLDESTLDMLGNKVVEWVQIDDSSREEWIEREARGIRMLGLSDRAVGGADFEGSSKAVHPLLTEACMQFQARAIAEIWPSEGPVKGIIKGKVTDERQEQLTRVVDFMNYQYTTLMPGAFEEMDKLLFRLPLSGSVFVKVYYDPLERTVVRRMIEPADFIVPYTASDLRTAPRYTHRDRMPDNDVKRLQEEGYWRKTNLSWATESTSRTDVHNEIDHNDGKTQTDYLDDQRRVIYECHCHYDLPGYEHKDAQNQPTGIGLPYIVTVDKDSQKVLAVRRNWRENDPEQRKRQYFVHYGFVPGLGFYYSGFLHLIGSLADSATGTLRALLDSAQFANMQGGFKSRDAKIPGGGEDTPIAPGEWRDIDCTGEDLRSAFFPLPYEEPSPALFNLLKFLDETGRRVASTSEVTVPETNKNSPVGTTLALIEQSLKVFSAVHKRIHEAATREFAIVSDLNAEWLPPQYPYEIEEDEGYVLNSDFDGRIDIIPVSDPNVTSNTQRITQAQAVLQLAEQAPDLYDRRATHRQMLEALQVKNLDDLLPDKSALPRMDAVSENMALMSNKPAKVFPDQDHQSHMAVHQAVPPNPAIQAHIAEHMAQAYRQQIEQMLGQALPPPPNEDDRTGIDPRLDYEITYMVASALAQQQQQRPPAPTEEEIDAQKAQHRMQLQQQQQEHTLMLNDARMKHEQDRADAVALREQQRKDAITKAELAANAQKSELGKVVQAQEQLYYP